MGYAIEYLIAYSIKFNRTFCGIPRNIILNIPSEWNILWHN